MQKKEYLPPVQESMEYVQMKISLMDAAENKRGVHYRKKAEVEKQKMADQKKALQTLANNGNPIGAMEKVNFRFMDKETYYDTYGYGKLDPECIPCAFRTPEQRIYAARTNKDYT